MPKPSGLDQLKQPEKGSKSAREAVVLSKKESMKEKQNEIMQRMLDHIRQSFSKHREKTIQDKQQKIPILPNKAKEGRRISVRDLDLHQNFVDLSKDWTSQWKDRQKEHGQKITSRLGSAFLGKVQATVKKNFVNDIESGKRLTLDEITGLKQDFKDEYRKVLLKEDKETQKSV